MAVRLGQNRQDFELLISEPNQSSASGVMFHSSGSNQFYWIDNIELYEAEIRDTDPDQYIRFEYNYSDVAQTIELDAEYIDVENQVYENEVLLAPYESIVLMLRDPTNILLGSAIEGLDYQVNDCSVELNWEINERWIGNGYVIIEKSSDGNIFFPIKAPAQILSQKGHFSSVDNELTDYYRIKLMDLNHEIRDSRIVYAPTNCEHLSEPKWRIYPNLASGNHPVNISYQAASAQSCYVLNQFGQVLERINLAGGENQTYQLEVSEFVNGVYYLYMEKNGYPPLQFIKID